MFNLTRPLPLPSLNRQPSDNVDGTTGAEQGDPNAERVHSTAVESSESTQIRKRRYTSEYVGMSVVSCAVPLSLPILFLRHLLL